MQVKVRLLGFTTLSTAGLINLRNYKWSSTAMIYATLG
jgi:hypothetical protein